MGDGNYSLGAFELGRRIGRGGMASVWSAVDHRFGGDVAVKVIDADVSRGTRYRRIFGDEVRAHARLDHPNIVRLLDYGEVTSTDVPPPGARPGDPYLVMEVAGGSLRDRRSKLTWFEVFSALMQILDALAYSHARRMIHRDLKPGNVLTFGSGDATTYKLSDFGIAHSAKLDETADRTALSARVGTPSYMAPEQFGAEWTKYGPWTDLYALGCLAYELTTGSKPFHHTSLQVVALSHAVEPMPSPDFRIAVPDAFAGWLSRLLEKEPGVRFQTAADAATTLVHVMRGFRGGREIATAAGAAGPAGESNTTVLAQVYEMTTLADVWNTRRAPRIIGAELDRYRQELEGREVEPIEVVRAPVPERWSSYRDDVAGARGLGLMRFRELRVEGQKEVRDDLWSKLLDVIDTGRARTVLLEGTELSPSNGLARWLGRRATEVGAVRTLEIAHSSAGGPREGLVGMLEDYFGTWALPDDEVRSQVEGVLLALPEIPLELYTAAFTQEILSSRGHEATGEVLSRAQLARMVAHLVATEAAVRPVLLTVFDAQWSFEAPIFIRALMELGADAPVLVIPTVRSDADAGMFGLGAEFEPLRESARVVSLSVRPYTEHEHLGVVLSTAPLAREAAEQICALTPGDPVASRLVISGLIAAGTLRATDAGYVSVESLTNRTLGGLLTERLESVLPEPEERITAAVAARLGLGPDSNEIQAVLDLLGTGVGAEFVVERLLDSGLATGSRHRWTFSHGEVMEQLLEMSFEAVTDRQMHRACGEAIAARATPDLVDRWLRAARHFIAADDPERALEPLYQVALLTAGVTSRLQAISEERAGLVAAAGLPPDHPGAIDQKLIEVPLRWLGGNAASARQLALEAVKVAREAEHWRGLGAGLRHLARLARARSDFEQAERYFAEAAEASRAAGEPIDTAAAAFGLGSVHFRLGDIDRAVREFGRARRIYASAGSRRRESLTLSFTSAALVAAGDLDGAERAASEAMSLAAGVGQVDLVSSIEADVGEIARFRGEFEVAREHYETSLRLAEQVGLHTGSAQKLNLGLVSIATGDDAEAERWINQAVREQEQFGLDRTRGISLAALAALHARAGNSERARILLDESRVLVGDGAARDIAWVLDLVAADVADEELRQELIEEAERHRKRFS